MCIELPYIEDAVGVDCNSWIESFCQVRQNGSYNAVLEAKITTSELNNR